MFKKRDTKKRSRKLSIQRERLHKLQELSQDELDRVGGGGAEDPNVPGAGGWGKPTNCCHGG